MDGGAKKGDEPGCASGGCSRPYMPQAGYREVIDQIGKSHRRNILQVAPKTKNRNPLLSPGSHGGPALHTLSIVTTGIPLHRHLHREDPLALIFPLSGLSVLLSLSSPSAPSSFPSSFYSPLPPVLPRLLPVASSPTCFLLDSSNTFDRTHTWDLSRSFFHTFLFVDYPRSPLVSSKDNFNRTSQSLRTHFSAIFPATAKSGTTRRDLLADAGMDVSLRHIVAVV